MVIVAVGSNNPVKTEAVRNGFSHYFEKVDGISLLVDSEVSNQPVDDIKGAENRARQAISMTNADFGVGIEGGVIKFGNRYYNLGFCVIMNKNGKIGTGTINLFECPKKFVNELKHGKELDSIDELAQEKGTKRKYGAIGFLPKDVIERRELYKYGVIMTLLPFIDKNGVYDE